MNWFSADASWAIHQKACTIQWRIQDFPEVGAPIPKVEVPTYYLAKIFPKTAWKWKNVEPAGARVPGAP